MHQHIRITALVAGVLLSLGCGEDPAAVLTPGTYRAYALVETPIRGQQLRSRTIEFEVR